MSTVEQICRAYAAAHPKRDGGSWAGWCASLLFRITGATKAYDNATLAGNAAPIVSADYTKAPIGAAHYWGKGLGHVAIEVQGGGKLLFMASDKVTESLGTAIGMVPFATYQARVGLPYRGWSMQYGGNANNALKAGTDFGTFGAPPVASDNVRLIARYLNSQNLGYTTTADKDGIPLDPGKKSSNYYGLVQTWGNRNGHYPVPPYKIDKIPGTRTRAIEAGPLLAAAQAWAAPPVTPPPPPPAWVPPTEAEWNTAKAEFAAAQAAALQATNALGAANAKIAAARVPAKATVDALV